MRAFALVVLAVGCGGMTPDDHEAAWRHVAELAAPTVAPGKTDKLMAAVAIRQRRSTDWYTAREAHARSLANYPEAEAAIALFVEWSREGGAAPPSDPMSAGGESLLLGMFAIDMATASAPDGLAAASYLGNRLLGEGLGVLDGSAGAALIRKARDRARELGVPMTGWSLPPQGTLVRVLASEAMWTRDPRALLAPRGDDIDAMVQDAVMRDSFARTQAFWLAALVDAQPGEPREITLERLRRVPTDDETKLIAPAIVDGFATQLDALR